MSLKTKLLNEAVNGFRDSLKEVVTGAAEDLQAYAEAMATDAIEIAMLPADQREPLMAELVNQAELLAEKHRLNAVDAGWSVVRKVTGTAIRMTVRMAGAALIGAI